MKRQRTTRGNAALIVVLLLGGVTSLSIVHLLTSNISTARVKDKQTKGLRRGFYGAEVAALRMGIAEDNHPCLLNDDESKTLCNATEGTIKITDSNTMKYSKVTEAGKTKNCGYLGLKNLDSRICILEGTQAGVPENVAIPIWSMHRIGVGYVNDTPLPGSLMTAAVVFDLEDYFGLSFDEIAAASEIVISANTGGQSGVWANATLNSFFGEGPYIDKQYSGDATNKPPVACGDQWGTVLPPSVFTPVDLSVEETTSFGSQSGGKWEFVAMRYDPTAEKLGKKRHRVRIANLSNGWGDCRVKPEDGCNACIDNIEVTIKR